MSESFFRCQPPLTIEVGIGFSCLRKLWIQLYQFSQSGMCVQSHTTLNEAHEPKFDLAESLIDGELPR
jgi:hypothetical protein